MLIFMKINFAQIIFIFFGFVIFGAVFLMPTLIAIRREHPRAIYIAIFNGMFAWTGLGWGIALVWAFSPSKRQY